jgi:hypothetical protein
MNMSAGQSAHTAIPCPFELISLALSKDQAVRPNRHTQEQIIGILEEHV